MVRIASHDVSTQHRPSDSELVQRALADPVGFEALYRRHVDAIYAFTCARVGPIHAEDVTADTFATAFHRLDRIDVQVTTIRPWLYGIAANQLLRHRAKERAWLEQARLHVADAPVDAVDAVDARIDAARSVPQLVRALALLSAGERDVLTLWVLEDFTHAQIAEILNIRTGTAKTRLSRARARLQALLGEESTS